MTKRWLLSIAALALISTRASAGDLPILIPYTGVLQKGGTPFSGSIPIQVTLTATDSAGTTTWIEGHPTVTVNGGRFNILLGSTLTPQGIPAAFVNKVLASGVPLTLTVTVNGTALNGTQTIYPSAFANASTGAKSSPSDFTANGSLTISNPATVTSSLLSTVIDALQITGVGPSGSRLIRLFDNVTVSGDLTANGNLVAGKGLKPDLDTNWFKVEDSTTGAPTGTVPISPSISVYRDSGDPHLVVIDHTPLKFFPSQIMIQACGAVDGSNSCTTEITILGTTGYHDFGASLNPQMVRSDSAGTKINMYIEPGWWIWGYWTGSWTCPLTSCFSNYLRVRAWR